MRKSLTLLTTLLCFLTFSIAFAQPAGSPAANPAKEEREQMAQAHDKMAACFRSTKTVDECREEMRATCASAGKACGMGMGDMMKGSGMKGHGHSGKMGMGPHGANPSDGSSSKQAPAGAHE